jgi:hypothetical protein
VAVDPFAIDASAGSPAYSGADLRLGVVVPLAAGAGVSIGARSGVRASGSGTDLLVQAQSSPNMTVQVRTGAAIIQGAITSSQGAYTFTLDAVTNLTIAAAHATLDRTDLVCIRIRDASVDTSGGRDGGVVVITGTNGGGVPSVPTDATYYVLAQVSVVHAVTSITSGAITDKRGFTAALGGTIPTVSAAAESALGTVDGTASYRSDIHAPRYYHAGVSATVSPGMVLIARQTLGVDTATVTFSGIPGDFSHLRITAMARSTAAAGSDILNLRFNADAGALYDWTTALWNDVTAPGTAFAGSNGVTGGTAIRVAPAICAATEVAGCFSQTIIDILHYADVTNRMKSAMGLTVSRGFPISFGFGEWIPASAAAVTSVGLLATSGSLKAGSILSLYGVS